MLQILTNNGYRFSSAEVRAETADRAVQRLQKELDVMQVGIDCRDMYGQIIKLANVMICKHMNIVNIYLYKDGMLKEKTKKKRMEEDMEGLMMSIENI